MSELVREIVEITAFVTGDDEHEQLTVEAEGLAPSAGWTNVRLEAHITIDAPEDGYQDFDLVGDRPSAEIAGEAAADALTLVEAAWEGPLEDWVLGVRVHGIDNMIEEILFEYEEEEEEEEGEEDEAA